MGGSPKRGGSNGGGALMSRGRVILVAVLVLQLVLVVCFMKAPWSSTQEEIDASGAIDEAAPAVSSGSWLGRMFGISTTSPNCIDDNGRVVTEVVKGSTIRCSDRSALLRVKWIEPKRKTQRGTKQGVASSVVTAKGPALRKVNANTVFRNSHGANAGLLEGRSRLRRGRVIGDARNSSSVVGDLRQERVQMGRDLPATGNAAMASDSEAARGTKVASWRIRKEFAANLRSSLERDSIRFRARTVGYGDLRQRSREGFARAREGKNASGVIARVYASNVSATIAPGARIIQNVSDSVAPVASVAANVSDFVAPVARIRSNVSDFTAPVARIRPPTLVLDDEQPDEEEPEVDELAEADPEVAVSRSEVSFEARQGPLPGFNADRSNTSLEISMRSNTSLEISPASTNLEISSRNMSLAEISSGNSSLAEISSGNSSLAEISSGNSSLAEISSGNSSLAEISSGNSSLADISSGNSSLAGISSGNSSLADISSGNSSLVGISSGNPSLVEISSGNTSLGISMRNSSLEISSRNTSLDQPSESLARNSTSLVELEQAASPLIVPSAAAQNATLRNATDTRASNNTTCPRGLLYVYILPKKFNTELLENCSQLLAWGDRCEELSNSGLGTHLKSSPLQNQQNASSGPWYATDQFNGEVIFHKRILAHPCRTHNPEIAKAFFIPYYGGLDVARFLFNNTLFTSLDRDRLGKELVAWLSRSPYWKRRQGLDHFLFLGRITWDFRRKGGHGWGSGLINMAEMANVTKLALERNPWDESETAIPYPTAFHPRNDSEVVEWQNEVRGRRRDLLFSFAGGKRNKFSNDFRVALSEQCEKAKSCAVLDCSEGKCLEQDALATTKLFMRSTFCLQPRGDSFTRRSIFDALVAGCIPVFFWSKSAYLQYRWHFPSDHRSYSVFIPKQDILAGVQIEDVLSQLPPAEVRQLQETVIEMIPRLVYAQGLVKFRDAFDTTIDQVMANFQLRVHQNASNGITEAVGAPVVDSKPVGAVRA